MKLPNAAHLCGENLTFETRDGIPWERCASCHYEAPVPRRPPTAKEVFDRTPTSSGKLRVPGSRRNGPRPGRNPEPIAPIVGRVVAEIMDTIEAQQERAS